MYFLFKILRRFSAYISFKILTNSWMLMTFLLYSTLTIILPLRWPGSSSRECGLYPEHLRSNTSSTWFLLSLSLNSRPNATSYFSINHYISRLHNESSWIFFDITRREKKENSTHSLDPLDGDFVSCLLEYSIIIIQGEFRLIAENKLDPRNSWVSSN